MKYRASKPIPPPPPPAESSETKMSTEKLKRGGEYKVEIHFGSKVQKNIDSFSRNSVFFRTEVKPKEGGGDLNECVWIVCVYGHFYM